MEAPPPSTDLETGLIAGIVIGVVMMLAVSVVVVLVRKRKTNYMPVPPKDPEDFSNANAAGIKLNSVHKSDSGLGIDSPPGHTPSSSASGEMTLLQDNSITAKQQQQQQAYLDNEQRKKEFFEKPIVGRSVKVEELENYVMERRDNEAEDLRKEYKVITIVLSNFF